MLTSILNHLFEQKSLSEQEAKHLLKEMTSGKFNASEMVSFITVFNMRYITLKELKGFRDALMELRIAVDLSDYNTIDVCGTGGDGKGTFNISTITSFVVAGAGFKVSKHGNYGASSISGSSNIMEYFGYKFTNDQDRLKKQMDRANICYLHAPLFNPAMKNIASIRRELGVKTFFNMLGPMVNPSRPKNQFIGVFSLELARMYNYLYQESDKNFMIIHSIDGYDEISLTSPFKLYSKTKDQLLTPKSIGFESVSELQIRGGKSLKSNAKIFKSILEGKGTKWQNDIVLANSALSIKCISNKTMGESREMAERSLYDGKAYDALTRLIELN